MSSLSSDAFVAALKKTRARPYTVSSSGADIVARRGPRKATAHERCPRVATGRSSVCAAAPAEKIWGSGERLRLFCSRDNDLSGSPTAPTALWQAQRVAPSRCLLLPKAG